MAYTPAGREIAMASPLVVMAERECVSPMATPFSALEESPMLLLDSPLIKPSDSCSISGGTSDESPFLLRWDDVSATNPMHTGRKGSNLALLSRVPEIQVPKFFCITTHGFKDALRSCHSTNDALLEMQGASDVSEVRRIAGGLKARVSSLKFPEHLQRHVRAAYAELSADMGETDVAVAVRPSLATKERTGTSSAGNHKAILNLRGVQDVLEAVKQCWVSLFSDLAVEPRTTHALLQTEAVMAVVIQVMIHPVVTGSASILTRYPVTHISASWGLDRAVVTGEVTPDEWLVESSSGSVIKQVSGSKELEYLPIVRSKGICKLSVSDHRRATWCLSEHQIENLRLLIPTLTETYKQMHSCSTVDVDFVVSPQGGLFVLQCNGSYGDRASPTLLTWWEIANSKNENLCSLVQLPANEPRPSSAPHGTQGGYTWANMISVCVMAGVLGGAAVHLFRSKR